MNGENEESKVLISKSILTGVATTIREREGSSALIKPVDFASHIASMSIGQQGAPVSSVTITNKAALTSIRPGFSAEIDVEITPPWEGWTYVCTSSDPIVVSVSPILNANGKYEITGVAESSTPVTITVTAGDFSDSFSVKCRDLFAPDLTKSFAEMTTEERTNLSNIAKSGLASEFMTLGQFILVPYGSYTMPFEIVGFSDVVAKINDQEQTVPAINLLPKYTSEMDSQWGASGSTKYSASTLRSTIVGSSYQGKFNSDFLACLAATKVQTYSRDGSTDVVYDKLYAPHMAQLGVTDTAYNNAQQAAVEGPVFPAYQDADNARRIKQAINATSSAQYYWTSSLYSGYSNYFGRVYTSGAPGNYYYGSSLRVVAACNFIG